MPKAVQLSKPELVPVSNDDIGKKFLDAGTIDRIECPGEVVLLSSLVRDPNNARLHGDRNLDAIKQSLTLYGQLEPLVVRAENSMIAAGNGRHQAMQEMGWTKAVINRQPMTDQEFIGFALADNRTAELAQWDLEVVARLERLVSEAGGDMVGWSVEDIKQLRLSQFQPQADPDDVPEPPKVPVTKLGDLWLMGEHRLLCGDCTDKKSVVTLMDGKLASLIFTDPPYGVAIAAKNRLLNSVQKAGRCLVDIKDDTISPTDLHARLLPAFVLMREKIMADDCSVFVTSPQGGELCMMMMMMMRDSGLAVRHVLIWKKNAPTFSMGRLDYDYQHEPILFTWLRRHKKIMAGEHKTSIWEVEKPRASAEHPTMKPVALPVNAMQNNSESGDVVSDVYLGSGTTLIAAHQLGRVAYCMEIDPVYVDVAVARWCAFTGQDATRAKDGASFAKLTVSRRGA